MADTTGVPSERSAVFDILSSTTFVRVAPDAIVLIGFGITLCHVFEDLLQYRYPDWLQMYLYK